MIFFGLWPNKLLQLFFNGNFYLEFYTEIFIEHSMISIYFLICKKDVRTIKFKKIMFKINIFSMKKHF